ncbi:MULTISPECIES: NAD(P)H-binding protein [Vagococcus]|uniref:Rrf2-linked NADH-flavin reductase n=1 Tax=Vagococcus fluvialis bH819 TaxID=1255619 RepID=A0A1X6WKF4_9ENTE|nr:MULTISPECIES: NAD(P)H-binding protein [Vagococcus]SLM84804.1 Rrf2-linked NADH-flavin reductase [Vagococcus fluvialis bH819]HCM89736.1 NADH-flavin reductase [Vagococcus sp.]
MKIGIIGATGKSGMAILNESVSRGLDVTAIVRNKEKLSDKTVNFIEKDLFSLTTEDLSSFDVVVDAFAAWGDNVAQHSTSLTHLTGILKDTTTRLFIVGGAGSLYVDMDKKIQLMDGAEFPDAYKPLAVAMGKALENLRQVKDVNWLYISPAAMFDAEGQKTGQYVLAGEKFSTNEKGDSYISYVDYAIAVVDLMSQSEYNQKRVSVRN